MSDQAPIAPIAPTRTSEHEDPEPPAPWQFDPNYKALINGFVRENKQEQMEFGGGVLLVILKYYPRFKRLFTLYDKRVISLLNGGSVCENIKFESRLVFVGNDTEGYCKGIHIMSFKKHSGACKVGVLAVDDKCDKNELIEINILHDSLQGVRDPNLSWKRNAICYCQYDKKWRDGQTVTFVLNCNDWTVQYYVNNEEDELKLKKKEHVVPNHHYYFVVEIGREVYEDGILEAIETPIPWVHQINQQL
eukprot:63571_1